MERKPITILPKYLDRIEYLPEDCRDAMISAIVYYGAEGRFPTFDKFDERDRQFLTATFSGIKGFLDESIRKREAGKLGGENGDGEAKNRYIDEPIASRTQAERKQDASRAQAIIKRIKKIKRIKNLVRLTYRLTLISSLL